MYLYWYNSRVIYLNNISCLNIYIFSPSLNNLRVSRLVPPGTRVPLGPFYPLYLSVEGFFALFRNKPGSLLRWRTVVGSRMYRWQVGTTSIFRSSNLTFDLKMEKSSDLVNLTVLFYKTVWGTTMLRSDQYWQDLTPLFITLWYKYYANQDQTSVLSSPRSTSDNWDHYIDKVDKSSTVSVFALIPPTTHPSFA